MKVIFWKLLTGQHCVMEEGETEEINITAVIFVTTNLLG